MTDRIFGAAAVLLAIAMYWATGQIEESFIQDPLGPKAFPTVIAAVMGASGLFMIIRPDASPHWPHFAKLAELAITIGVLVAYAQLLPIAGFVLATAVATAYLCWRLGANARQSVIGGIVIAGGIHLVRKHLLGINLAKGPWGF